MDRRNFLSLASNLMTILTTSGPKQFFEAIMTPNAAGDPQNFEQIYHGLIAGWDALSKLRGFEVEQNGPYLQLQQAFGSYKFASLEEKPAAEGVIIKAMDGIIDHSVQSKEFLDLIESQRTKNRPFYSWLMERTTRYEYECAHQRDQVKTHKFTTYEEYAPGEQGFLGDVGENLRGFGLDSEEIATRLANAFSRACTKQFDGMNAYIIKHNSPKKWLKDDEVETFIRFKDILLGRMRKNPLTNTPEIFDFFYQSLGNALNSAGIGLPARLQPEVTAARERSQKRTAENEGKMGIEEALEHAKNLPRSEFAGDIGGLIDRFLYGSPPSPVLQAAKEVCTETNIFLRIQGLVGRHYEPLGVGIIGVVVGSQKVAFKLTDDWLLQDENTLPLSQIPQGMAAEIFDHGKHNGVAYIVTERLNTSKKPELPEILDYLFSAHEKGVVYCDPRIENFGYNTAGKLLPLDHEHFQPIDALPHNFELSLKRAAQFFKGLSLPYAGSFNESTYVILPDLAENRREFVLQRIEKGLKEVGINMEVYEFISGDASRGNERDEVNTAFLRIPSVHTSEGRTLSDYLSQLMHSEANHCRKNLYDFRKIGLQKEPRRE